ncbi:sensor histidine kinase [Olivibacter jilunii]|uniref:sensor histidine kinase n=1 Tax=Olivibacter jilunii TaxID=985016 RepID=UPI00102F548D|nr:histidine kinase [Olivibacter jilunii]
MGSLVYLCEKSLFRCEKWLSSLIIEEEPSSPRCMVTFLRKHPAILHLLIWVVYIHITYVYNGPKISNVVYIHIIGLCVLYAGTFYSNFFLFRFLREKKCNWWQTIGSVILLFMLVAYTVYYIVYFVFPFFGIKLYYEGVPFNIWLYLRNVSSMYIKYTSYALVYYFVMRVFQEVQFRRRMELTHFETEREKFLYEQAFLRAQINPHFLHNTLNFIYTQALSFSESLAKIIYQLSLMMRYSVDSASEGSQLVPLHKELEYLEIYLKINNARFGKGKHISYKFEGDPYLHHIPPLLFITLVENGYKHGDLSDPTRPMQIRIVSDRDKIYFYSSNKRRTEAAVNSSGSQIGLKNLKRRLIGAFGEEKVKLTHTIKDEFYTVELLVDLS